VNLAAPEEADAKPVPRHAIAAGLEPEQDFNRDRGSKPGASPTFVCVIALVEQEI
jgi:hypothetical protein